MSNEHGTLFVVSAPSGGGKNAILRPVLHNDPNLEYSISATTRPPRQNEVEGKDYYYLSLAEFCRRIEMGEFVEWAEVHGQLYGTLRSDLDQKLASGKDLILELDVLGMRNLKATFPDAVTVFIMAPSLDELERRLRERGTDDEASIRLRLKNAEMEMAAINEYDHVIVNEDLDVAIRQMKDIIRENRRAPGQTGA